MSWIESSAAQIIEKYNRFLRKVEELDLVGCADARTLLDVGLPHSSKSTHRLMFCFTGQRSYQGTVGATARRLDRRGSLSGGSVATSASRRH